MAKTYSRYDFMKAGVVMDPILDTPYPDPLSINYFDLTLTELPKKDTMTSEKIIFFWKETENIYGLPVYDDIVLTLNGVPHKNLILEGDTVYFPQQKDIEESFQTEKI